MSRDPIGQTWLPALIGLFQRLTALDRDIQKSPGELLQCRYSDELAINPPLNFLLWLVQHPEQLRWPSYPIKNDHARDMRERLLGRGQYKRDPAAARNAGEEAKTAIQAIIKQQQAGLADKEWLREWWVLEGKTHVDCFIETTRMKIYVEGKRTDRLSPGVSWYSKRNQLLRNLECASVHAGSKPFIQVMIAESPMSELPSIRVEESLPHLTPEQRNALLSHYAGSSTWKILCARVGIDFNEAPDRVQTSA